MSILSRYLLKLHAAPFAFALGALTSIMLINQVAKQIGKLLGKGLPWSVIAEVFLLSLPYIIALTLPMAVLVAVLFAVSRLSGDNEITAMRAGGVSMWRILRPLLVGGACVSIATFLFNDRVLPQTNQKLRVLLSDIQRKKPTFSLNEQVINEVRQNQFFLRTTRINPATYGMRDVSIYDVSDQDHQRLIYADSGRLVLTENQEDALLTLFDGVIHEFDRSDPRMFQQIAFREDVIRVTGVGNELKRTLHDEYRDDRSMNICQMEDAVHGAQVEELKARHAEARVRLNALRATVGLAPLPADTVVPTLKSSLYCRAMDALKTAALPVPLAAQQRPQGVDTTHRRLHLPPEVLRRKLAGEARARDSIPAAVVSRFNAPARAALVTGKAPSAWTGELRSLHERALYAQRRAAGYLVEIHKKYAIAAACLVFVLVGVPVGVRFRHGGLGLVIGVSLAIFSVYYVGLIAGESLANRLIVPAAIMWAPNVLFAIAGVALLGRMRSQAGRY